ncbi:MAG: hypothetical protein OEQ53_16905 [Saprospiraceae bacterium]|nr:hypothetical protein [Saprospiraceae bacterium]
MNKSISSSMIIRIFLWTTLITLSACQTSKESIDAPLQISGIYPHLAYYNSQGECGTGAVVPWADRLWVITYSPHYPHGSDDKLYEITPDLKQIIRGESIGGTPANRMVHRESQQLFIGPYAIDSNRKVRAIPYKEMQGRHTGNARHLSDPAGKIYYATMEEGFYEVDVNTLQPTMLYEDANNEKGEREVHNPTDVNPENATLPGAHGKGLYSGQGVMVYSNNGEATSAAQEQFDIESGGLAEWNGKDWTLVRRNQFVEVTGPGGIYGNTDPKTDPIWVTGWDHKSIIIGVRNQETGWDFYRLPKASHSYDGAHGWNTEWPRIRNIGTDGSPNYLMTMHGMFWQFPSTFTAVHSSGIRPRSAYLKVIGDFTRWRDRLVFGCDDSAQREFLNKRKHKGGIEGPGQSNSNLWFTDLKKPDRLGPTTASGSVWLQEKLVAQSISEPFLFAGWSKRCAWIRNEGNRKCTFVFEVDKAGNNNWEHLRSSAVDAAGTALVEFDEKTTGEWIRVVANNDCLATVHFNYSDIDNRRPSSSKIFEGLTDVEQHRSLGGLLYGLGNNRRSLGISTIKFEDGSIKSSGYYELNEALELQRKEDQASDSFIREKFAIPKNVVEIEESSVLIIDDKNRRWRLPLGNQAFEGLTNQAQLRICREVATERDLFNCMGTFYELPAENADGFAKIRPVASHDFRIHDYASYRGMLVMTGISNDAKVGEHIIRSQDGNAAVWVGVIDDLWDLGKPRGKGGPWKNSTVAAGVPSDAYLIGHYDKKRLELSHQSNKPINFEIEVEPLGHGPWMLYREVTVKPGDIYQHEFTENFQARWIRFVSDQDCEATAWLNYE